MEVEGRLVTETDRYAVRREGQKWEGDRRRERRGRSGETEGRWWERNNQRGKRRRGGRRRRGRGEWIRSWG